MNETISTIWQSEATMEAAYTERLKLTKLDRTKDARKLVWKLMEDLVGQHAVPFDVKRWILENVPDFNIRSQLLLNTLGGFITFKGAELQTAVKNAEEQYKAASVMNPFAKGAKFIETPEDDNQEQYNRTLGQIRNAKILGSGVGLNSFRISPIGSTPALADAHNLSSLSIVGLKPFLKEGVSIKLLKHDVIAKRINLRQREDGGWIADGLEYPIHSSSGGDIAPRAIAARWAVADLLGKWGVLTVVVPKYDSLLIAGAEASEEWLDDYTE